MNNVVSFGQVANSPGALGRETSQIRAPIGSLAGRAGATIQRPDADRASSSGWKRPNPDLPQTRNGVAGTNGKAIRKRRKIGGERRRRLHEEMSGERQLHQRRDPRPTQSGSEEQQ